MTMQQDDPFADPFADHATAQRAAELAAASRAPAAWYPDPEDPSRARWWDGTRWSADTLPSGVAQSLAPRSAVAPGSVPAAAAGEPATASPGIAPGMAPGMASGTAPGTASGHGPSTAASTGGPRRPVLTAAAIAVGALMAAAAGYVALGALEPASGDSGLGADPGPAEDPADAGAVAAASASPAPASASPAPTSSAPASAATASAATASAATPATAPDGWTTLTAPSGLLTFAVDPGWERIAEGEVEGGPGPGEFFESVGWWTTPGDGLALSIVAFHRYSDAYPPQETAAQMVEFASDTPATVETLTVAAGYDAHLAVVRDPEAEFAYEHCAAAVDDGTSQAIVTGIGSALVPECAATVRAIAATLVFE
ncbi:DUF2510 domain-containing protein [Demequina pelophila]|uniref:DUF2510 domain-containing protein n=1 Tax=Demequina pelophila TaxID=1638984 RepID=UPI00078610BE|nr:DUF2510 domain-containing protein [Demequina pelophila]